MILLDYKTLDKYSTLHYFLQKLDFVRRFDGSSISFNTFVPTARQNISGQRDRHTHRQTDVCLQKIYVEGPVQNNEKTKIEKSVWIAIKMIIDNENWTLQD